MFLFRETDNSKLFDIKTTFRKNDILKPHISKTIDKTKYTMIICDSCAIFPSSLKNLGKSYNVPTLKGDFPHRFANENTVFYTGTTPDITYYDGVEREEYNKMFSNNWNFKNESLK